MTALQKEKWHQVSESEFEQYLKTCPDYTCNSYYPDVREFRYRLNGKQFAELRGDIVFVDLEILNLA